MKPTSAEDVRVKRLAASVLQQAVTYAPMFVKKARVQRMYRAVVITPTRVSVPDPKPVPALVVRQALPT